MSTVTQLPPAEPVITSHLFVLHLLYFLCTFAHLVVVCSFRRRPARRRSKWTPRVTLHAASLRCMHSHARSNNCQAHHTGRNTNCSLPCNCPWRIRKVSLFACVIRTAVVCVSSALSAFVSSYHREKCVSSKEREAQR